MKRVTFAVSYPDDLLHPIHREVCERAEVSRAELLQWGPTASVTTLTWYDAPAEIAAAIVDAISTATDVHLTTGDGGTYAFVAQTDYEFADPIQALVERARVIFRPPVTFLDDGAVRFTAVGDAAHVAEFHDQLTELGDCRIDRVTPYSRTGPPTTVTERQQAALSAAAAVGYYDVPRSGSIADVAARLDCAHSTAGELVRNGEAAVLSAFVGERRGE